MRLRNCIGLALLCALLHPCAAPADDNTSKRPFRLDDFFEGEHIIDAVFAPDGQALAIVRRRPESSQVTNGLLIEATRDDIWVQLGPGHPAKNLTNGAADASGWWDPKWSPDGEHLAFLSSRGGEVTPWVWERRTGRIRQIAAVGIDFDTRSSRCRWVDDVRLLCPAVLEGERSTPVASVGVGIERATEAWRKAARGELSVSAVNSLEFKDPLRRLVLLELHSREPRTIATTAYGRFTNTWWLSPDRRTVAVARPAIAEYPAPWLAVIGFPATIELYDLERRPVRFNQTLPNNVVTSTLGWSPDGRELAFFALGDAKIDPALIFGEEGAKDVQHEPVPSSEYPGRLWRVDLERGRVEQADTGDVDLGRDLLPPSFIWTADGELVYRARRLSNRAKPHLRAEPTWLVVGRDGRTRDLVDNGADTKNIPSALRSIGGGRHLVGLAAADVWSIDVRGGSMRNLTEDLNVPVRFLRTIESTDWSIDIILKAGEPADELSEARILERGLRDYVLEPTSGQLVAFTKPEESASLLAVHAKTGAAVYEVDDLKGSVLWRGRERVVVANAFRSQIIPPEQRVIEYRTLSGVTVKAKLTLPIGYVPGRRYPLVVDSDIGYTDKNVVAHFGLDSPGAMPRATERDAWMFAAAGYAYLFASCPTIDVMDDAGRPNLLLFTNGILPAAEAVVQAGIADADRLFLYGNSSFGYGVLGLVTQTPRFRAAVAEAGWADQVTVPLMVRPDARYSENPYDLIRLRTRYSSSPLPVWRNADHYRRNSPLTYVDRVRTPLMIVHGDLDTVPIYNIEMFFAALVMQRKPAQFVRYWGEGHGTKTPANTRDMFRRIFAWFDQHGDILRDSSGALVFDGQRVRSRNGQPPLKPQDFTRFGPAATTLRADGRSLEDPGVVTSR